MRIATDWVTISVVHVGARMIFATKLREMESHELGNIRVHTDQSAHEATESLGANAFAAGSHIWFRNGAYQPDNSAGPRPKGGEEPS